MRTEMGSSPIGTRLTHLAHRSVPSPLRLAWQLACRTAADRQQPLTLLAQTVDILLVMVVLAYLLLHPPKHLSTDPFNGTSSLFSRGSRISTFIGFPSDSLAHKSAASCHLRLDSIFK
ncbi:unnamed protein product [Protopolystoma xenopodis]|uniref:Uncharacterized protein n=1 Tax=Protopolystoma xenopodis TaxID=117903 RepID=A0A448XQ86_9PLAT|nr:unnamed protein product [Protopolystoma xenopodis]